MMNTTKILIIDDHALVRESLRDRLEQEIDFEIIAIAGTGDEAVELAVRHSPDVILMDIDMPGLICFDAARTIMLRHPETQIIFVSAFFNDRYIEEALAIKAGGYLTKNEPPETIIQAIREVVRGIPHFSDEIRARIVVDKGGAKLFKEGHTRASTLSRRELEVLRYISRGMHQKEIAQTMHVSSKTVDNQTTNLMKKLDIHNRVDLTRFAIREGLADA